MICVPGITIVTWSPPWGIPPIEALVRASQERGTGVRFVSLDPTGQPASGDWPTPTPDELVPSRLPGTRSERISRVRRELHASVRRNPDDLYVVFDLRALAL